MSEIRVNKVVDETGLGAVELKEGAVIPAGKTLTGGGTISFAEIEAIKIRANGISDEPGLGPVVLLEGATLPADKTLGGDGNIDITGNARITGITTVAQFSTDTINANKIVDQAGTGPIELTEGAVLPSGKTLSGNGEINIGSSAIMAGMIKIDGIVNKSDSGPVKLTEGAEIPSGKTLSGAGNINITGDITIGGTTTFDDVTNVDSIGTIQTQEGFIAAGISTFKGAHFDGGSIIKEKVNVSTDSFDNNNTIDLQNGMIDYRSTALTALTSLNLTCSGTIDANMSVGEAITVNAITVTNNDTFFVNDFSIDNAAVDVTLYWVNEPPSNGGSSGVDIYTFTIVKTADIDVNLGTPSQFLVIGNQTKTS